MADNSSKQPRKIDLDTVKALAALMSRHELTSIDLHDGGLHIRLRRGPAGTAVASVAPSAVPPPLPALGPTPKAAEPPPSDKPARLLHEIKSPTPGTFYAQEKPTSAPYVKVGDRVTPTTVVCQIEAMKIFNEITAECTGALVEICVENKQPVEYGQVLFRVDPSA